MNNKELNYGEVLTLHAFWETCKHYFKKHIGNDLEIEENIVSLYKKNDMWYLYTPKGIKEYSDSFSACTKALRIISFDEEEENELLHIFTNILKCGCSYDQIEVGYKVFKKCII